MGGQNAGIIRRRRIRRVYDGSVSGVFVSCGACILRHNPTCGMTRGLKMKHDGDPYGELRG